MKKTLCLLGLLCILTSPAMAKGVPYITYFPYKEYKKEITLDKLATNTLKNDIVIIEKNKYQFNYIPKMGFGYEYSITNNTDKDITLKGIKAVDFYNDDISDKSNKPLKNLTKATATSGKIWIPFYGLYYGCRCDAEKNKFIRNFPQDKVIKAGESLKVLASATKEHENPVAEFIFIVDDVESIISF